MAEHGRQVDELGAGELIVHSQAAGYPGDHTVEGHRVGRRHLLRLFYRQFDEVLLALDARQVALGHELVLPGTVQVVLVLA